MPALAVEHHAHARELAALEPRRVGQIGRRIIEEFDHLPEVDHRVGNLLVLAELMVGGVQVGEIDAVKGFDVGTGGFRIVERGGDEVVEINGLDVEGLAHVSAAVA